MRRVFINSLPKAGTNLVARVFDLLGYRQRGGLSSGWVMNQSWHWRTDSAEHYSIGIGRPIKVRRQPIDRLLAAVPADGYLTAHVGYDEGLRDAVLAQRFGACVIVRDPRAVLASFVHHVMARRGQRMHSHMKGLCLEERYRFGLYGSADPAMPLAALKTRCEALTPWLQSEGVCRLSFEDLVGPKGGGDRDRQERTLRALAALAACEDVDIADIAARVFGPGRHTFRRGLIDGWRDELPEAVLEELMAELAPVMQAWGYA